MHIVKNHIRKELETAQFGKKQKTKHKKILCSLEVVFAFFKKQYCTYWEVKDFPNMF